MSERKPGIRELIAAGLVAGVISGDSVSTKGMVEAQKSEGSVSILEKESSATKANSSVDKPKNKKNEQGESRESRFDRDVREIVGALEPVFGKMQKLNGISFTEDDRDVLSKLHPGSYFYGAVDVKGETYFFLHHFDSFNPDLPINNNNPVCHSVVDAVRLNVSDINSGASEDQFWIPSGQYAHTNDEALADPNIDMELAFEMYADVKTLKQKAAEIKQFYQLYSIIENPPELQAGSVTPEQLSVYVDQLESIKNYPWSIGVHPDVNQKVDDRLKEYEELMRQLQDHE
jgi:hypothetical protein